MADERLIEAYVAELAAQLRAPRGAARRILAEVRDHLSESAERFEREGVPSASSAAIAAFGEPALVARRFGEQIALSAARGANRRGLVVLVALLALSATKLRGSLGGSVVLVAGVQVALVAGVLSLARAHAANRTDVFDATRLRYLLRGHAVVAVCAALAAASLVPEGTVPAAVVLLACGAAALATLRGSRRLAALEPAPPSATGREALADLGATVAGIAAALPLPAGALVAAQRLLAAALRRAPWLRDWVDPALRPWRFACLVAMGAGLALPAGAAVAILLPGNFDFAVRSVPLALAATALKISIEASLVLAGYVLLGGYLGLRPALSRSRR